LGNRICARARRLRAHRLGLLPVSGGGAKPNVDAAKDAGVVTFIRFTC
jgi:hypothetical protein